MARGEGCVTLFYQRLDSPPSRLAYSTSPDGLEFTEEHQLDLDYPGPQAGANVQLLADGSLMLYFDAMDGDEGNHIRAARLTVD